MYARPRSVLPLVTLASKKTAAPVEVRVMGPAPPAVIAAPTVKGLAPPAVRVTPPFALVVMAPVLVFCTNLPTESIGAFRLPRSGRQESSVDPMNALLYDESQYGSPLFVFCTGVIGAPL